MCRLKHGKRLVFGDLGLYDIFCGLLVETSLKKLWGDREVLKISRPIKIILYTAWHIFLKNSFVCLFPFIGASSRVWIGLNCLRVFFFSCVGVINFCFKLGHFGFIGLYLMSVCLKIWINSLCFVQNLHYFKGYDLNDQNCYFSKISTV